MEKIEILKEDLMSLISHFRDQCSICDELNIYEWEEADKEMQEKKEWVNELETKLNL